MATAVADSTETPLELAALLSIAVVACCIAGKVEVSLEPRYVEPVNLYTCAAMGPGNRKTAVYNHVVAPLLEFERDAIKQIEPERKRLQSERRTMEARYRGATKKNCVIRRS
ncbi:MAG: DUF3987 domain-containing protein [Acidobacteriia bacterium]|nr:DUF3987 domain-containing protein [Terriglobia bacterium]